MSATWRDLIDQLTPEQIDELEYCEHAGIPPGLATPQHRLNAARSMAAHNLMQALCADIAPPPEAVTGEVYAWQDHGDDRLGRMYDIWTRDLGATKVDLVGVQYNDGQLERHISLYEPGDLLTADQARQLGAALIEAADQLDRLGLDKS